MPLVAVVTASESDTAFMQNTCDKLAELGVDYGSLVTSAHRNPEADEHTVRCEGSASISDWIQRHW